MQRMRRMWFGLAAAVIVGAAGVNGQTLVGSRSFSGVAALSVSRPGWGSTVQQVGLDVAFTTYRARLTVAAPGSAPVSVDYNFVEIPNGSTTYAVLFRGSGASDGVLPGMLITQARGGAAGTTIIGFGSISGTDTLGRFSGAFWLQLQQVVVTPSTPTVPEDPVVPEDPAPSTDPALPAFDGRTLRVPAQWGIRKFEGFAYRLTSKFGTLPGGTTASVPSAWTSGVMQCHGAQGFVYELPLMITYQGFAQGMILYTPNGTFPSWEDPSRWQAIAGAGGYTKYRYQ